MAKARQMPPEAAVEMANDFASTPDFDAHLASTRRERFQDGQAIDVPVTVAWGERERLMPPKARRRDELPGDQGSCNAWRLSHKCPPNPAPGR
jgi:pimeloyl-ACP methyl ester carboxylesterase